LKLMILIILKAIKNTRLRFVPGILSIYRINI
jgi:hypothetical protein